MNIEIREYTYCHLGNDNGPMRKDQVPDDAMTSEPSSILLRQIFSLKTPLLKLSIHLLITSPIHLSLPYLSSCNIVLSIQSRCCPLVYLEM
jgi:hypothetical protein